MKQNFPLKLKKEFEMNILFLTNFLKIIMF